MINVHFDKNDNYELRFVTVQNKNRTEEKTFSILFNTIAVVKIALAIESDLTLRKQQKIFRSRCVALECRN